MKRIDTTRPLTPRERHIAELLASGQNYRAVGSQLGISVRTVAGHVNRIAAKIPGSLSAKAKVIAWSRGATADTLM